MFIASFGSCYSHRGSHYLKYKINTGNPSHIMKYFSVFPSGDCRQWSCAKLNIFNQFSAHKSHHSLSHSDMSLHLSLNLPVIQPPSVLYFDNRIGENLSFRICSKVYLVHYHFQGSPLQFYWSQVKLFLCLDFDHHFQLRITALANLPVRQSLSHL